MARPICVDLFSGVGGLSLGFEQAGFDVIASVDIDPIHCAAHKFNFPNCTTVCASVIDISGNDLRGLSGIGDCDIDVVVGGAPCQGFSMMGKRALDDPRNQLVHHFVRVVLELSPKYFVLENVKGLTLGKHRKFLTEIIDEFDKNNYNVVTSYQVLNSADFGVPQDRKRLFLLGARKGLNLPTYPSPSCFEHRPKVWDAIGDLPEAEGIEELWTRDSAPTDYGVGSTYSLILRGESRDTNDFSYLRDHNRYMITSSLLTRHSATARSRFAITEQGYVEPVSRFKKLHPQGLCNTLRAGTATDRGAFTSPRPIHPYAARVITVREAARLHSYPDWFRFHVTKWHGFRQIGNSVPPMLGRAVAEKIIEALEIKPIIPTVVIKLGEVNLLNLSITEAAVHFGLLRSGVLPRKRKLKPISEA